MCRLRNIGMGDYQESVTTGQTDRQTHGWTDTGQSDPYVPLCFACDTINKSCKKTTTLAGRQPSLNSIQG